MKISLHYVEEGEGFPLILLHGNGEEHGYFKHQIAYFSEKYRVIAPDTRGHGKTPRGEAPFTIRRFAEDLKGFMDEKEIERAHILGFSDGGNIALCFALKYPERVERLILNGANLHPDGVKRSVQLPIEWGYRFAKGKNKEMLGLMVNDPMIDPAELEKVTAPTLVIAGTGDMIKESHTRLIAEHLPHARLTFLPGDHFIAAKNPEAFNREVENFLSMNIRKTVSRKGKDQFVNHVFSPCEWSAPIMVSPYEIKSRIGAMNLVGRTIKNVRVIGHSFWHTKDWLEEAAYNSLSDDMPEEERMRLSDYENIPDSLVLLCQSIIGESFLILFEDGDTFEIDTPQVPEFQFSMNCVPWDIGESPRANLNAEVLFRPVLGHKIVEVEVAAVNKTPDSSLEDFVERIVLWLDSGIGLSVSSMMLDYCSVECINRNDEVLTLSFGELRPGLHND